MRLTTYDNWLNLLIPLYALKQKIIKIWNAILVLRLIFMIIGWEFIRNDRDFMIIGRDFHDDG